MKFVTAGGMRIDYLITHTGKSHAGLVGGNALYATVGAAIWEVDVNLWARIGRNYPPAWLETLQKYGIGIEGLVRLATKQDHRTFYAYTPDGRRDDTNPKRHYQRIKQPFPQELKGYIHSTPGQDKPDTYEPLALRAADWPLVYDGATAVHFSPLALSTHLHTPPALRQRGISQITVDPGERYMVPERLAYIRRLVAQIDAFLPSAQEARSLFGQEVDLWEAASTFCEWGVPLAVVKDGANGVLVFDGRNGRQVHLPAYHSPGDNRIIDVTGAGDGFCGGFMVGLAQTGDSIRAARMGIVSASLVIEEYGALYALSKREEAQMRLNE